jgi:hydrogenase nickel incorporation protein HypA/HybF
MLMHEAAVAQSLFEVIAAEAKKQRGKPIRAKISCGTFHTINDELLRAAYEAISRGTDCENVEFEIENKPIMAKCNGCGRQFEFDLNSAKCSHCGSEDFKLLPDEPLILEEIEFETE